MKNTNLLPRVPKIIIIGEKDLDEGKVTVKDMVSGNQELVDIDDVDELYLSRHADGLDGETDLPPP